MLASESQCEYVPAYRLLTQKIPLCPPSIQFAHFPYRTYLVRYLEVNQILSKFTNGDRYQKPEQTTTRCQFDFLAGTRLIKPICQSRYSKILFELAWISKKREYEIRSGKRPHNYLTNIRRETGSYHHTNQEIPGRDEPCPHNITNMIEQE